MTATEIGQKILNRFAELNSKVNHIIDERWLNHILLPTLNPKEKDLVNDAIQELINDELVTTDNRAGGFCLVLTQNGYDRIYQVNSVEAIQKIKNRIMRHFEDTNSKPSHIIQERWLTQTLIPSLNPKERELVNAAIQQLIDSNYITYENKNGMNCLVLTQTGYDTLY